MQLSHVMHRTTLCFGTTAHLSESVQLLHDVRFPFAQQGFGPPHLTNELGKICSIYKVQEAQELIKHEHRLKG